MVKTKKKNPDDEFPNVVDHKHQYGEKGGGGLISILKLDIVLCTCKVYFLLIH